MPWIWITAEQMRTTTPGLDLPAGSTAFINGGSETLLWGRVYEAGSEAGRQAAAEFAATALAAARVAAPQGSAVTHRTAVLGDGMLACLIRTSLVAESPSAVPAAGPTAAIGTECVIIDTTGSVSVLSEVVKTLPRLGRLVLAAPPCSPEITLATYRDIHVRGLDLIGVPWAGGASVSVSRCVSPELIEAVLTEAARARPVEPAGRPLYVLDGRPVRDSSQRAALPHSVDVAE
jgi:hypothetical protein